MPNPCARPDSSIHTDDNRSATRERVKAKLNDIAPVFQDPDAVGQVEPVFDHAEPIRHRIVNRQVVKRAVRCSVGDRYLIMHNIPDLGAAVLAPLVDLKHRPDDVNCDPV